MSTDTVVLRVGRRTMRGTHDLYEYFSMESRWISAFQTSSVSYTVQEMVVSVLSG